MHQMKKNKSLFSKIATFFDRKIAVPITKLVVKITGGVDKSGKRFEKWLSKTNTLLFISLILAVTIFIVLDQKIITFSENSAEVLKSQPISVIYNEEAYVVEGLPETVDITLIGSKTDLFIAKQSASSEVKVDLTGLKPGQHKVNLKYSQSNGSIDYRVNPSVATVIIYPKVSETKILTLDLINQENLDSKLTISKMEVENDRVIVKGADYQIKQVATVKALVNVDNIVKQEMGTTTIKDATLKAYDSDGNIVDVELVPNKIDVNLTIDSPSKQVPIKVIPKGDVAFGLAIASIEQSETMTTIYGDESVLTDITSIPVYIDVSDLKDNHQYKVDLEKPVGIRSMSISNVTVKVQVATSADVDIMNVKVDPINLDSKYIVQAKSKDDLVVTVNVKGVESVIKQITTDDIQAYIDLKDYTPGEYEVEVKVTGNDPKATYVSKTKKIHITIMNDN